jgi:hypothetical protein
MTISNSDSQHNVLSVIMLSVVMLSVVMLNDIMLSVVVLNVVMLGVVAPSKHLTCFEQMLSVTSS